MTVATIEVAGRSIGVSNLDKARPGAPVATPVAWHEPGRTEPASYTITNIFRRLRQKEDHWAAIHSSARPLAPAHRRLEALRER